MDALLLSAQVPKNENVGQCVGWLDVGAGWQCWSLSCFLVPTCPWEPLAAKYLSHRHP